MIAGARFVPLIVKQVWRNRTRSLLTVLGVALAMFLFTSVQAAHRGVSEATQVSAADTTLVVYRQNRYCPFSSQLPEHYGPRIERVPGVVSVVPTKVVVNNCRAGLDVVTFRGVPEEAAPALARRFTFLSGSLETWLERTDAAMVGRELAARRRLRVGDAFDAAGITVTVAAVVDSYEPQDRNAAWVRLGYLQRTVARGGVGIVTQFSVQVDDPQNSERIAEAIDAEFARDADPTSTRPEKAFVANAARDIIEIIAFTRWLGWAALAAVLALVANAIVLGVQDRIKEHAVLQTLGFRPGLIARLIVAEGLVVSIAGGLLGTLGAFAAMRAMRVTMTVEGVSMNVSGDPSSVLIGLAMAATLGVVAGLIPAWQASRREIVSCFRTV
jgi:putative ABC transport system permease protein